MAATAAILKIFLELLFLNQQANWLKTCGTQASDTRQFWPSCFKLYEPIHDKTYNKTFATSKDSDQPVHPGSLISHRWCHVFYGLRAMQRGIIENPCHTGWIYRLIRVFASHTGFIVGFVMRWVIFNWIYLTHHLLPVFCCSASDEKPQRWSHNLGKLTFWCVPNKDSYQPASSHFEIWHLKCTQGRFWSGCMNAQADLNLLST